MADHAKHLTRQESDSVSAAAAFDERAPGIHAGDDMKSNAPWSVKGIERDARETAKEAARREGLTVGEWLNQLIYLAGDPSAPATTGEEVSGVRVQDLVTAIDLLNRKAIESERRSVSAIEGLARSFGGVVERVQRLERTRPADEGDLGDRVAALEAKSTDRQRIDALRALEKAVGQIALQFDQSHRASVARLDGIETQIQDIATQIDSQPAPVVDDSAVAFLRTTVDGLALRLSRAEKIASEAARIRSEAANAVDPEFVERTGARLRVLGEEIKRGGDQIKTLETSIARLSTQIDAAERRSSEGVEKVAETISELREQFASADAADSSAARAEIEAAVSAIARRTEDRIGALQSSFDEMVRRLEGAGTKAVAPVLAPATASAPAPAATLAAAPAPRIVSDIEEAFAEIDDEPAATDALAGEPEPEVDFFSDAFDDEPQPAADDDKFGFDLDEPDVSSRREADADEDADSAIAAVRQSFGLDPAPDAPVKSDVASVLAEFDDISAEDPPLAEQPAAPAAPTDYLKAARLAAREAAARAETGETAATQPRSKLTPKQRAILAARAKRRKLDEQRAETPEPADDVGEDNPPAAVAERTDPHERAASRSTVKDRIASAVATAKSRAARSKSLEPSLEEAFDEPAATTRGKVAGLPSTLLKNRPVTIALGAALLLSAAALAFMLKDVGAKRAGAPVQPATPQATAPVGVEAADAEGERLAAPTAPAVDPRTLYLDSYSALKTASNDQEIQAAIKGLIDSAALGHPPAQLQIGEFYKIGQGVAKDPVEARKWFERAANGGNVLAMHRLGVMSARGDGGPVDPAASITWFEKAAALGLVDSQYNLGATYHPGADGAAAQQDRAKAYFWYSLAARNGDSQAGQLATSLAAGLSADDRARLDGEVAAWKANSPDYAANESAPAT